MRPSILVTGLCSCLSLIQGCNATPLSAERSELATTTAAAAPTLPFNTTYVFSVAIGLGQPPSTLTQNPITIPGGVVVPEPILNGTVSGPAFNGTIISGLATPAQYENQNVQVATIDLYGVSSDGYPFRIHETGVGSISAQITRIEIDIGGGDKYKKLRDGFIMATVNAAEDRKSASVMGYLVQNQRT
ncbi:hypothetical protein LTR96_007222 [Exophiala xenobiotica]|nr:hypothetical protein LTS06_011558 [Exophiala xenobiotica]KAK5259965.1 hypothetical protein LTR40_004998 [Exophiala xenobiotica]KAK5267189.1 hypothetical protein LTR96_007222 [Exophiala xenobiotica]KAK5334927.1 hypothetical protein LTR98_008647 [Exophiala xenobiotica]KAK5378987.1 hypothetical protein LTS13_003879 [Exophiala xenobiotica]